MLYTTLHKSNLYDRDGKGSTCQVGGGQEIFLIFGGSKLIDFVRQFFPEAIFPPKKIFAPIFFYFLENATKANCELFLEVIDDI